MFSGTKAENRREEALRNSMKSLFKKFDDHYMLWSRAIQCLSILDVLVSLAMYVKNAEHEMCRPEIVLVEGGAKPFVDIRNGRHPCLAKTFSGDFIPNDVVMGSADASSNWQRNNLMILTGPNMGGKSTLMRQTGLTVILAQMVNIWIGIVVFSTLWRQEGLGLGITSFRIRPK